ncbi:SUMF1/EgtB/PvdO family nonheme iron enzyme [Sunxiuqinia elliptica]|uniref:Formylglycine-generating enzyme required for sulfatase activity n=1 Tax=Sunxiuqinia elliptica TaxID=655355 RepID=A0A4V3BYT8_9BACT|nr:SUMF1/EgtB/PvdO family nonheme iron enzyme [Sunxiuqinia elliptica]TDO03879.1 formylglycine-generating enzyme required for sulfatase activity [Sunxiuqinia elliptica]TDO62161.1 formylglycine-generating enzyme required for sulfatase activity [Sunxiuqinia elliptica]
MKLKLGNLFNGKRAYAFFILLGVVACLVVLSLGNKAMEYTSTDDYCMSCHVHPHAEESWKLSTHYNNEAGVIVHCVECHLPPKGHGHLVAKAKHGFKDVYGMLFKDSADFNWEEKRKVENAQHFVYKESCLKCHQNLFPTTLSPEGDDAHLYYLTSKEELRCINCHLHVGHHDPNAAHEHNMNFGTIASAEEEIYEQPTPVSRFESFTEKIPGTSVSFEMVAVPGGAFQMGSPEKEPLRDKDEGPVFNAKVSNFWMGKVEVSWEEYLAFFKATSSQGRKEAMEVDEEVDGITGPTPPWGAPDQGWGKGSRPAITMSWHAANTYCRWLTQVTGKKYRLPTEAEWEYACRAGSQTPYPFEGSPKDYSSKGFLKKIFSPDTAIINSYVAYELNSNGMTMAPEAVKPNAFGLKNMSGNVAEFCLDYYDPAIYQEYSKAKVVENPRGPKKGREHVVRGGSFKSDAKDVRSAARDYTRTKAWLMTDPQMPKSIWWYSDVMEVGFRVVCEVDESIEQ